MALPITSKPIENTPEHLAWEEWLMNHPHDFHQNKTKKVTPKSIFLFRNKTTITSIATEIQCPPNHRFFDGKCIPTVEIDRDQILLNQLHNLLNNEQNTDYDYDYESQAGSDEEVDSIPVATVDKGDQQPFKVQFTLGEPPNHTRINDDEDAAAAAAEDTEAEFWQKFRDSVITTTTATATTEKTMEPPKNTMAEAVNELSDMEMSESDQTTKIIKGDLMTSETNESSYDLKRQLVEESFILQPSTTTTEDALLTTTTEISSPDYFTELAEDDDRLQSTTTAKILNTETTTIESSGDDEVMLTTTTTYPEELESTTITIMNEIKENETLLMQESQQAEMKILDVPTIKLTDDNSHIDPTVSTHSEASKRFVYHHTENEVVSKKQKQPLPVLFRARYAAAAVDQAPSSTATTTISTTTTKSTTEDEDEDYWWLPSGWRLDQSSDKPLLLRFWSQLPSLYSS